MPKRRSYTLPKNAEEEELKYDGGGRDQESVNGRRKRKRKWLMMKEEVVPCAWRAGEREESYGDDGMRDSL